MGIDGKERNRKMSHLECNFSLYFSQGTSLTTTGALFTPSANFDGYDTSSRSSDVDLFDGCEMWSDETGNTLYC
jgi:hypothetical protein